MRNAYVKSIYYKFVIFILSLTIIIATFGCGSGSGAQNGSSDSSIKYSGSVSLSWYAPTRNEDGTKLTDLSGYKVYYGTSPNNYTHHIDPGNVTTVNISNLAPGMYYFALVAYDQAKNESDYSREISIYVEES